MRKLFFFLFFSEYYFLSIHCDRTIFLRQTVLKEIVRKNSYARFILKKKNKIKKSLKIFETIFLQNLWNKFPPKSLKQVSSNIFETNIPKNLWNSFKGSTNERAGSDHVIWGPMRGPQTLRLFERIGQGPMLWKLSFKCQLMVN